MGMRNYIENGLSLYASGGTRGALGGVYKEIRSVEINLAFKDVDKTGVGNRCNHPCNLKDINWYLHI